MNSTFGKFTHAVVCRIPNSAKDHALSAKKNSSDPFFLDKARAQHADYVYALRKLGLDVIELPPDEALPDCMFAEDTTVMCNDTALITRPGVALRRKEVETIRSTLRKEGLRIVELPKDTKATIDGSDVLFTGHEFFVGLSPRTNIEGAKAVAHAFPEYPVQPIRVRKGPHLKSFMSMAGPDLIAIGSSEFAKDALKQMEELSEFRGYQILTLPDDEAANVMYVNGTLIHCTKNEFPNSYETLVKRISYPRIEVSMSELAKLEGSLSCCSILYYRSRTSRRHYD